MILETLIRKKEDGNIYVNSLELHNYLGIKTRHNDWIKRQIKNYNFEKDKDFAITQKRVVVNNGGYKIHDKYELTLNTAKELCMVERTQKGKEIRNYFIEIEELYNKQVIANLKLGSMLLTHKEKLQLTKELFYPILDSLGVLKTKRYSAHQTLIKQVFGKYENLNKLNSFTDEDINNYKKLAEDLSNNNNYFIDKNQVTVWDIISE